MLRRRRPADSSEPTTFAILVEKLTSGILGRGAVSYFFAFAGISISSFVFHVLVSRLLGPSHYGVMGALLGIIGLLTVPIGATQIAVTQAVMNKKAQGQTFSISRLTLRSVSGGVVAMLALDACAPLIDGYLHIRSPIPMYLVASWIPVAIVSAILQGALIGEYRFRPVAFATFFGSGVIRLALGAVMVESGFGVSGAVASTIFAQLFTVLSLSYSARHELFARRHASIVTTKVRDATLSVAALTGYTTLIGVDTFLARHFFIPVVAGKYAAVVVVAHVAFFVPTAIVTVAFPHLVEGKGVSPASRKIFTESLLLSVGLGVLAAVTMAVFPGTVMNVLFGNAYSSAASIVGVLSFTSVAIGIIVLFVYLHLARRSLAALAPWVGVLLSTVLIYLIHGSMMSIALIMFIVSMSTLLLAVVPALLHRPVPSHGVERGPTND